MLRVEVIYKQALAMQKANKSPHVSLTVAPEIVIFLCEKLLQPCASCNHLIEASTVFDCECTRGRSV